MQFSSSPTKKTIPPTSSTTTSVDEEIVELPSTSTLPSSIISRHQLSNSSSPNQRPFTVPVTPNLANTVITASNVNNAKRQFTTTSAGSSTTRRSCSIVSISTNPIRKISPTDRAPIRALSFATQENISTGNTLITSASLIRRDRSLPRSQSATVEQKSYYQVLAFMYCGTLEAAADARWLCDKKINLIINLTGVSRMKIRSCSCSNPAYHSPIEYLPKFDQHSSYKKITEEFHKINDLIQEARNANYCILVFNTDGYDLCQAIAIEYMIDYYGGHLLHHINSLQMKVKVKVKISQEYMEVLAFWEKEREKDNPRISREHNNKALRSFSFKMSKRIPQI